MPFLPAAPDDILLGINISRAWLPVAPCHLNMEPKQGPCIQIHLRGTEQHANYFKKILSFSSLDQRITAATMSEFVSADML